MRSSTATRSPAREAVETSTPVEVSELAAMRAELDAIGRRLEALERRHPREPEQDLALLSALAATFGGSIFSVADIRTAGSRELQALIGGQRPRAIGQWLRRLSREAPTPYAIEKIGRDAAGCQWSVSIGGLHARP